MATTGLAHPLDAPAMSCHLVEHKAVYRNKWTAAAFVDVLLAHHVEPQYWYSVHAYTADTADTRIKYDTMCRTQCIFNPKNHGKTCAPVYRTHPDFELLI